MGNRLLGLLLLGLLAPSASAFGAGSNAPRFVTGARARPDAPAHGQAHATTTSRAYMLQLPRPPLAATFAASGHSVLATRSARAMIEADQRRVRSELPAVHGVRLLFSVHNAYDGVAVLAPSGQVRRLAALPGVARVHVLPQDYPDNASSVPLIGAPTAWQSNGKLGDGITIGIIDTGIDYIHTDFGGPGTGYASNSTTSLSGTIFPTAKVVGGTDLAGDAYNANDPNHNVPVPDPNPMDCAGHGTHVAGTAAGFGVNADGSTYTGTYDTSTPFSSMRIGPGVAPHALLYAIRVFGCSGSTDLIVKAIDWAMDPNNDGNLSDHLNVINMSLGARNGFNDSPDSAAANQAARAGVIVAISAGNDGDNYEVTSSPGDATRAVTTASSVDSTEVTDGFTVTGLPGGTQIFGGYSSNAYNLSTHSPTTAGLVYPSVDVSGCSAFSGADATAVNGNIVLLDWVPTGQTTFPCGSATRVLNAYNAGAVGVLIVDSTDYLSTGITGDSHIPSMITTQTTGNTLKANLGAGLTVTFTSADHYLGKVGFPGRVDTLSSFSSRGPAGDGGLKPDLTAPGDTIFSAAALSGNQGTVLSGTSMATPHVAGALALLRQLHASWTVEQLKAALMNTATHPLTTGFNGSGTAYAPQRVGSGRIDVAAAMKTSVVAYQDNDLDTNTAGDGAVSVSFGSLQVTGPTTLDRVIRVVNKGSVAASYTAAYVPSTTIPGVSYSLPDGSAVSVPAGGTVTFRVELTADPTLMKNSIDPTVSTANGRYWLPEAAGLITLTPPSGQVLQVPVYATARPASTMAASPTVLNLPAATTGTTSFSLGGTGVSTGSSPPTDYQSLVTAFELQGLSPKLKKLTMPRDTAADIRDVGVSTDYPEQPTPANGEVSFAISTYGDWSMPVGEAEFDIYIDTNRDGTDDYLLWNTTGSGGLNQYITDLKPIGGGATSQYFLNGFSGSSLPTGVFFNNVMVLPVSFSALGMGSATRFNYRVVSFGPSGQVDSAGPFTFDVAHPGLDFQGGRTGELAYYDNPANAIPVASNKTNITANASLGALLFHYLNAANRVQEILIPKNIVKDPGFETPATGGVVTTFNTNGKIGPWKVTAGSVQLEPAASWTPAAGQQSLDLAGTAPGTISQTLTVPVTGTYKIAFSMAGDPGCVPAVKDVGVGWNGTQVGDETFDTTGHTTTSMGWATQSVTVSATAGANVLSLTDLTAGACGPAIDQVTMTQIS